MFLVDESPILKLHESQIQSDPRLQSHLRLINSSIDFLDRVIRAHPTQDDNHVVELRLQIRILNSGAASLRLAICGYWHACFTLVRDLLETYFLIDLFATSPEKLVEWRTIDEKIRRNSYAPAKVRKALDQRDGYSENKREAAYKLLCNYAAHPTPEGFSVMSPNGLTQIGPYPSDPNLRATLEEISKHMAIACEVSSKLHINRQLDIGPIHDSYCREYSIWKETLTQPPSPALPPPTD